VLFGSQHFDRFVKKLNERWNLKISLFKVTCFTRKRAYAKSDWTKALALNPPEL